MKKLFAVSFLIFLAFSCQIEENPNLNTDGNLLIKIDPKALLSTQIGWVMVHDIEGNLLDFGRVTGGSQNYFDTQSENVIHITFAKSGGGGGMMQLESITNVSTSEEYTFGLTATDYKLGDNWETDQPVEITLKHAEPIMNFILSHFSGDYSAYMIPASFATFNSLTRGLVNQKKQKNLYPSMITARSIDNELRFIVRPPDKPRLENPIIINFNEMYPFQNIYQLPVSKMDSFYYEVSEIGIDDNYYPSPFTYYKTRMVDIGSQEFLKGGESFLPIGTPYRGLAYFKFIGKLKGGILFHYHTYGSFPENIKIPKNETISVRNQNPENLDFSSFHGFDRFRATWLGHGELDANGESKSFIIWNLIGENTGVKIIEIPTELQNSHPLMMNPERWILSTLMLTESNLAYNEFVKNTYIKFRIAPQEETSVGFGPPFN
jgi:hypothetical protein